MIGCLTETTTCVVAKSLVYINIEAILDLGLVTGQEVCTCKLLR